MSEKQVSLRYREELHNLACLQPKMEFGITYEEELRDAMPMEALEKSVREMAELLIERVKEARRGNLLMRSKVL